MSQLLSVGIIGAICPFRVVYPLVSTPFVEIAKTSNRLTSEAFRKHVANSRSPMASPDAAHPRLQFSLSQRGTICRLPPPTRKHVHSKTREASPYYKVALGEGGVVDGGCCPALPFPSPARRKDQASPCASLDAGTSPFERYCRLFDSISERSYLAGSDQVYKLLPLCVPRLSHEAFLG